MKRVGWSGAVVGLAVACAVLLGLAAVPARSAQPEPAWTAEQQKLAQQAAELNRKGFEAYQQGKYVEARKLLEQALQMRQQLYPREKYPPGHPHLANSLNNQGLVLQAQGEYDKALTSYQQALEMYQQLYPKEQYPQGHPGLAGSLHNLGSLLKAQGEYSKALTYYRQALLMNQRLYPREKYPQGHPRLAAGLNNLGGLLWAQGEYSKALGYFQQALEMLQHLYPKAQHPQGHPELAASLNNLGFLLEAQGEYSKALAYYQQAQEMLQQLYPREKYPQGHPHLAGSLSNLGALLRAQGEHGKALTAYQQALEMFQQLYPREKYPQGHPHLAGSLNNLGLVLRAQGEYGKALTYYQQALQMYQQLYPKEKYPQGHPDLANSLNNLGHLLQAQGEYGKALDYYQQTLQMYQQLYPKEQYPQGHRHLALSLSNLGALSRAQGESGKALAYHQQVLEMDQRLYPKEQYPLGHPHLAASLVNLGFLLQARGEHGKALTCYQQALQMHQAAAALFADTAAEAEALNFLATVAYSANALLSASSRLAHDRPEEVYTPLWRGKGAVTLLLQRRQQLLRDTAGDDQRRRLDEWLDARRQLARLLLAPADRTKHAQRLQELTERKERLERELARTVPELARQQARERAPHTDLLAALPAHVAFLDCYRYTDFEQDPKVPGKNGERRTQRYAVFVLQSSQPLRRVELGEAGPLEDALRQWRRDLDARRDSAVAGRLRQLLWEPIARQLAPGIQTVYIAPDGLLGALPWAALPGGKPGTVLLEEHAFAVVPYGPFLLDRLGPQPQRERARALLAVGGVRYDQEPKPVGEPRLVVRSADRGAGEHKLSWRFLPGTAGEIDQVLALARRLPAAERPEVREWRDSAAGTAQLWADLPQARIAHLATHGFFAAPQTKVRAALGVEEFAFARGVRGLERAGAGARNPLVQCGLVLAGANLPAQDPLRDDGGILTAEALAGLDLRRLELAVLSACESGLGEADLLNEGVFGLQRAFHLAGAQNVVASLWKVDDEATAALMQLFYHQLWVEKKPPLEALRQAQLYLYRNPAKVGALARGAPDFFKDLQPLPKETAKPVAAERSPARHWAAFVLSGAGR